MTAIDWKLLRAAACIPLAVAATHTPAAAAQMSAAMLTSAADQNDNTWSFHHEHVLGTSLGLTVRAATPEQAEQAEAAALVAFDRHEAILSSWRADSEFSRWAGSRFIPTAVSPELFAALAGFDHWREQTNGALDPSAEAAARLWRGVLTEGRQPTVTEIAQTVEAMQQPHWSLDVARGTATRLTDVPLAFASFVKSAITAQAADAAMQAGATGIMLNVGGDVVVRGALTQVVAISDPRASAENDGALDHVVVRDRAVATSGSYRRSIDAAQHTLAPSHILDPRTAHPTGHILSSTVIARDAGTAGALATAFSVLSPEESRQLAARTPGVDYLLVTRDGAELRSAGWAAYQLAAVRPAAFAPSTAPHAPAAGMWNPAFELSLALELPRTEDARYRRPYVAVWVEDADHFPVRTIALWTQNPRWLPELKSWYRDDQIRNLAEGTDVSKTISSATRPPGKYTLKWDGKDNEGKPVKAGKYTICVEASREHGGYQVERRELDFNAKPQQTSLSAGKELGTIAIDYRKR